MASGNESRNESTVDESNGLILDPMIWKHMPAHLVEKVLSMVPFASVMRFRTLSTDWNSLIMSPKFARDCQRQQAPKPVPIVLCARQNSRGRLHHASVKLLNSKTHTWVSLPVPVPTGGVDLSFTLTACSGGLLCFSSADRRQFVIWNPLTRAFRCLEVPYPEDPEVLRNHIFMRRYVFTGLLADQDVGTFKLVVVNLAEVPEKMTLLYNSADRSWRSGAPVVRRHPHPFEGVVDALTSKQSVYGLVKRSNIWTVRNVDGEANLPQCTLLKYDVRNDSWHESSIYVREADSRKNALKLLEHQSHILLVTRTVYPREYTVPFRVEETSVGHQMNLVEERYAFEDIQRSFNDFRHDTAALCWAGDGKYSVPGGSESEGDCIMVVRFDSRTRELSVLPPLSMSTKLEKFSEIRVLEPSVTIDVAVDL